MAQAPALWRPSKALIQQAQVSHFGRALQQAGVYEWDGDFQSLWQWSVDNPESFWSELWDWHGVIGERLGPVMEAAAGFRETRFFPQARLNFAENLLEGSTTDAHAPALIWHAESAARGAMSRAELRHKVMALAGWLQQQGVQPGDRVAAYVPNIPEAVINMLATAAVGGVYSSCSTDFGYQGVLDRFGQIEPKILLGVNGYRYNGKVIRRDDDLQRLQAAMPSVEQVLWVDYLEQGEQPSGVVAFSTALQAEPLQAYVRLGFNDPLYILYSSGTTGAPKCIVHGVGGTLLQHIKELRLHSDVRAADRVFYFTTCGWMMWNWLVSALAVEATVVLYEGNPFYPGPERLWEMAAEESLSLFGTSAKYLDALRKSTYEPARSVDLSALRTLCSTGSPLSADGFDFVYGSIKSDLQLASISGGTDIVSCFVLGSPLQPVYAGEIQTRGLGMNVAVLNDAGEAIVAEQGELCCLSPFPSQPVAFWNDPGGQRYEAAYFGVYDNVWRHGDWATLTERGGVVIHGRSDAVLNPGGVRIGTAEIYRPVEAFDEVLEALVIGQQWQGDVRVILFVRLQEGVSLDEALQQRLRQAIRQQASPRHVPALVLAVPDIPRTRSGKITELAVRDVIHGRTIKNTEALANPECLQHYRELAATLNEAQHD